MRIAAFYEDLARCGDLSTTLDEAIGYGLEAVYISGNSLLAHPELPTLFEEKGLPIEGIHQHFDFAHASNGLGYRTCVHLAAECRANSLLVVPGLILPEDDPVYAFGEMVLSVRKIYEYAKINYITVCIEPFDHLDSPTHNAAGLKRFLDNIPGLACAFDTGNFVCDNENPLAVWPQFVDKICLLHLKDRYRRSTDGKGTLCSDGLYSPTAPVGSGVIPIKWIIARAKHLHVNAVIELCGCDDMMPALKSSLAYVRSCLGRR